MKTLTADSLAASTDSAAPNSFTLRIDQSIALSSLHHHFVERNAARGQYISACGTGKTVVMTRLPQVFGAQTVVVLVPSLNLVSQTWDAFTRQLGEDGFRGFIVCSDDARAKRYQVRETEDRMSKESPSDFSESELATQHHGAVLREASEIAEALDAMTGLSIVFSTYQSVHLLLAGVKLSREQDIDLAICDEAHFLATNDRKVARDETHLSNIVLRQLPAKRMIFATATPVEHPGAGVFSMSNTRLFGAVAHEYSYPAAREDGVVAPFDIVLCSFDETQDKSEWLMEMRRQFDLKTASMDVQSIISHDQVRGLAVAHTLAGLISDGRVKRALTYSNRKRDANAAAENLNRILGDGAAISLDSDNTTPQRQAGILKLEAGEVNVITNCFLFQEGYDAPALDAIAFIDPRQSVVDIIQAIGRACRIPQGVTGKRALVIIPVHEYETEQGENIITEKSGKTKLNKKRLQAAAKSGLKFAMLETVLAAMSSPGLRLYDSASAVRADLSGKQRKAPLQALRKHWRADPQVEDTGSEDAPLSTAGDAPAMPVPEPAAPPVGMSREELNIMLGGSRAELLRAAEKTEPVLQPDEVRLLVSEPLAAGPQIREFNYEGRDDLIASYVQARTVQTDRIKYDSSFPDWTFEQQMEAMEHLHPAVANLRADVKIWRTLTLLRSPQGQKILMDQLPSGDALEAMINGEPMFAVINRRVLGDVTNRSPELQEQKQILYDAAVMANYKSSADGSLIRYVKHAAPSMFTRVITKFSTGDLSPFERAAYEYAGVES